MQKKLKVLGVIPARYSSSRLPGKPLVDICGLPMIVHTMKRAEMSEVLDEVIVATDDIRIYEVVESYGGKAIMTSEKHNNGSERMCELAGHVNADFYCLINGDEALVDCNYINMGVEGLKQSGADISILYNKFYKRNSTSDFKVVINKKNEIMYISRADIPSESRNKAKYLLKAYHVMTYRRDTLLKYPGIAQTEYDFIESHELLRLLENGFKIQGVEVGGEAISVDTPEDLEVVRAMMLNDTIFQRYRNDN